MHLIIPKFPQDPTKIKFHLLLEINFRTCNSRVLIKHQRYLQGYFPSYLKFLFNIILKTPSSQSQATVIYGFDNGHTHRTKQELCFFYQTPKAERCGPSPWQKDTDSIEWGWKILNNSFSFLPGVTKGQCKKLRVTSGH